MKLDLSAEKKTIIIIDDDKSILSVLTRLLEKKGYVVTTAENGKDSIDKIERFRFSAALIDVRLPDMLGTEVLLKIQEMSPKTVKIVFTGSPYLAELNRENQYMDAFLIKPVKPEILINVLEEKLATK